MYMASIKPEFRPNFGLEGSANPITACQLAKKNIE